MLKFKPLDWFHIPGRGWAAVVRNPEEFSGQSPLIGTEVEIDGVPRPVRVLAVETHKVPVIRKHERISLLTDADPRQA